MKHMHGGQLQVAQKIYGGELSEWLDLSTGISPWTYPLPPVPEQVWQRLPEEEDSLREIAANYYGVQPNQCVACPGSQWAIEQIPYLYPTSLRVAMIEHGYSEHPHAWINAGHQVSFYPHIEALLLSAHQHDAAVIINPHNPLGTWTTENQLKQLQATLRQHILVIDEAFADTYPASTLSLVKDTWRLRSVGKFWGLAGLRIGFVLGIEQQIQQLEQKLSPWAVNHIARWASKHALVDTTWHAQQKQRLQQHSDRLKARLDYYQWSILGSTDFFITAHSKSHVQHYHHACQHGILLRHLPDLQALRFGLPHREGDWLKFEKWLSTVSTN